MNCRNIKFYLPLILYVMFVKYIRYSNISINRVLNVYIFTPYFSFFIIIFSQQSSIVIIYFCTELHKFYIPVSIVTFDYNCAVSSFIDLPKAFQRILAFSIQGFCRMLQFQLGLTLKSETACQ